MQRERCAASSSRLVGCHEDELIDGDDKQLQENLPVFRFAYPRSEAARFVSRAAHEVQNLVQHADSDRRSGADVMSTGGVLGLIHSVDWRTEHLHDPDASLLVPLNRDSYPRKACIEHVRPVRRTRPERTMGEAERTSPGDVLSNRRSRCS